MQHPNLGFNSRATSIPTGRALPTQTRRCTRSALLSGGVGLALILSGAECLAQTANGFLDFGTTADGTTATTANTGFGGVRVGTGGGGFTIANTGQSIGTAGELRGVAPTVASINSVGITSAEFGTAATTFTISFELYLSGGSAGTWYFFAGNGTSFGSAQSAGFTGNQVFTGLRWTFGASSAITTDNRAAGAWAAVSGTPFAQGTAYYVTIVGNNSASTVNYGASQSVAANTYDLWVNGVLVGNDLAKGQLAATTTINSFRFYGENSAANVATLAIDNVRWYNTCVLPPTHLAFFGAPTTGTAVTSLSAFTVEARSGSASGPVATAFTGTTTLGKASGSGTISGTLTPAAVAGVATYSDIQFSAADTYTMSASGASPIVSATSGNVVISPATAAPTVNSPTSSGIGATTATLGATFQADGGASITDYGVVWGTSANPTTADTKVQKGTSSTPPETFTVSATGLPAGTLVHYRGYAINSVGTAYSADGSFTTLASEPPSQASGVGFSSPAGTTMTVSWTRGGGANCIVLVKAAAAVNSNPVDGTTYTANANFGSGTQIGTGNYVVYKGSGTSVNLTGLAGETTYYVAVYELNGSGGTENYLTTLPATGSQATLVAEPTTDSTGLGFSSVQTAQMDLSWTSGNGANRIVVAKAGSAPTGTPSDGSAYSANAVYGSGDALVDGYVVYNGSGNTFTVTGLSADTVYYFKIFEYNGTGGSQNYYTSGTPGNGSRSTLASEPATQASGVGFSSVTSSGMTITWTGGDGSSRILLVKSGAAVNSDPVDGTSYTANPAFGSGSQIGTGNYVVHVGSGASVALTGLSPGTTYHVAVYELNGASGTENYLLTLPATGSQATAVAEPTSQASAVSFNSVLTTQMGVSWTSGNGGNRIVVAKAGGAPTGAPSDGTGYTANAAYGSGDALGDGFVVYNGPGTSFTVTGLSADTVYYFKIFEYNGSGVTADYLTSGTPGNGSRTSLATEPTSQASSVTFSSVTASGMTINWTGGDGSSRIVLVKSGSAVNSDPVDGTSYSADVAFGSGTQIGAGNYVVYVGSGASVAISGLSANTTYHVAVYELNGTSGAENYLTTAPATGNHSTLAAEPTTESSVVTFNNVQAAQMGVAWTSGNGASRIVVAKAGSAPSGTPTDGTSYTANAAYGSGDAVGDGYVVYNGSGNSFTATGLSADTTYHFKIFEFNGSGLTANYRTSGTPGTASKSTLAAEPTTQASGVSFSSVTTVGMTISWTAGNGATRIVLVKSGSAVDSNPVDGTSYSADVTFPNGSQIGTGNRVVYVGSGSSVAISGLSANTTYHVAVYELNGATGTENYLTTSPAIGNQATILPKYRSNGTGGGNWNVTGTWRVSNDGGTTWNTASATPTSVDDTIEIGNGDTVAITASVTVDQVTVESGGQLTMSSAFTVNNGTGDDIVVQNGGVFQLGVNSSPPTFNSGATVKTESGGIVKVAATGLTANAAGVNLSSFVYGDASILDYTLASSFSASGVTFFPNVNASTIPIFRLSGALGVNTPGGGSATVINGVFEVTSLNAITWSGIGTKTFRNGIRGSGTVTQGSAGQFIISGATADLGGGTLTLGASGLQINSGSVVTLSSDKTVTSGTVTVAGTVDLNGHTLGGISAKTVSSTGTLKGAGAVNGTVTVNSGGTVSPGSSIGTITLDTSPSLSGTLAMEIDKTSGVTTADKLACTGGGITYGGTLAVTKTGADALAVNDSFTLFTKSSGTFSGWFSSVSVPTLASGLSWDTNKLATTGVLDIYTFTTTPLTLSTPSNTTAVIPALKLANHASSSRGTPVAVSATTPGHGTAGVSAGELTYTPTTGYGGSDSFTVTFNDGQGTQTMAVSVTVGNGTGQSPNVLAFGTVGGNFFANFAGIPGTTYTVESNSVASGTGWAKIPNPASIDGKYTAPTDNATYGLGIGVFQLTDPIPGDSSSRFYRTVWPSY